MGGAADGAAGADGAKGAGGGKSIGEVRNGGKTEEGRTCLSDREMQLLQESFERRKRANLPLRCVCSRYDPHGLFTQCPTGSALELLRERAAVALAEAEEHAAISAEELDNVSSFAWLSTAPPRFDVRVTLGGPKKRGRLVHLVFT